MDPTLPSDRASSAPVSTAPAAAGGEELRLLRDQQWLSRMRSYILLDPLIFLYTGVFGAMSLSSSFFDRQGTIQHGFARRWSQLILKTSMAQVEVVGGDVLQQLGACVIAPNHISAMDIPVLYAQLPFQFRIVANKYLFSYPFLGWHLRRSGQIAIDRSSPRATFKSLSKAVEDLKRGLSVVIFPEGGRSRSGTVQPFMNGAFYLAVKAQVPVVPTAIVGTYEMLPMDSFHIQPRPVKLVIGEPIETRGMTAHHLDQLCSRVQSAVEELYYSHGGVTRPRDPGIE